MQKRQDISDIFGKYSEVDGEGALFVNFRQKKDDSYDFSGKYSCLSGNFKFILAF